MTQRSPEEVLEFFEKRSRAILGAPEAEGNDGRVAIRLRNREKIIDALIELIVEGRAATIDEIVERSGVARRSVFRHFTDLSDMMLAAVRTVLTRSLPHSILNDQGVGPLDKRIESFVDARIRTLATWHPFRSGANARLTEMAAVKATVRATAELLQLQISNHFADELSTRDPALAENIVDAIYVATSYESYDISVAQLGRPIETVRATWVRSVHALLESSPRARHRR